MCKASRQAHAYIAHSSSTIFGLAETHALDLVSLGLCHQPANCGIVKDMELTVPEEQGEISHNYAPLTCCEGRGP